MKWKLLGENSSDILSTLLKNRGIQDRDEFLNPKDPCLLSPKDVDLDSDSVAKAKKRIEKAVSNKEKIIVYGDYDADGMCATAILFEALSKLGANVLPFIPNREKDGYGLSKEGLDQVEASLVISADSGIVAHEAVEYANSKGIDIIILDHHEKPEVLPKAYAIVHTTKLCAAGISYIFAKEFGYDGLELAAIATVTDLMPLIGANRSIVKYGLKKLNETKRPGLLALFKVAGVEIIGTYEIGYIVGPRLNASGRIDSALTGLRLLCTKSEDKALEFARELDRINRDRQLMLEEQVNHAMLLTISNSEKIIVAEDDLYHQGIIGLIAGKLTEKYYLPSIVISKGKEISKASARSINGFNIIESIRELEPLLVNAGGHPMAAGFTIETTNISTFKEGIVRIASEKITAEMLERVLKIDCKLNLDSITMELYQEIAQMAPFGVGNPEPTFTSDVTLQDLKAVGSEGKHLKLKLSNFDAIAFGKGNLIRELKIGDKLQVAYTVDLNVWNGRESLQLKIKDIVLQ